jgi:putative membrane protein
MMGYGYSMMGGWFGMMILPIILIVVIIYVIYNQGGNNRFKDISARDNSLDILNERFARGEINEEEYNNKKNILQHK